MSRALNHLLTYTLVVTTESLTPTACRVTVLAMSTQTEFTAWRPQDTLATRLLVMRHQLRLSQREAALRAGLTFGEWQSMENGAAARGIDQKVVRIAAAFDVDRDWLMWGGPLADPFSGPTTRPPSVTTDRRNGVTTDRYFGGTAELTLAA